MLRKFKFMALSAIMVLICLSACGKNAASSSSEPSSDHASQAKTLQIVTTIFPEYDWVRQLLGDNADNAEITLLLDNGVDLHSYQPTAEDILKISTCDLFIYVGGESDKWAEDALREAANKDMVVINLMESLGENVKEEEIVEGMEHSHDHDHEEEEQETDEHVWLSLRNAGALCGTISDALCEIDPVNSEKYKKNADRYIAELSDMDKQYQEAVSSASKKTLLFCDRFPFRYLVDDYGLDYYAAFSGCSAETEASFKTITFLSGKVDEINLNCVLTIEKSDQKIAGTVIRNTQSRDQKILTLDSMQSTTSKDISDGAAYLSIMESNLDVLKEALK